MPRHQNILDDLMHIKIVNGVPQIDKGRQKDLDSIGGKGRRHGDFAVALMMAIRASFMQGGAFEFTAIASKAERDRDDDDYVYRGNGGW